LAVGRFGMAVGCNFRLRLPRAVADLACKTLVQMQARAAHLSGELRKIVESCAESPVMR